MRDDTRPATNEEYELFMRGTCCDLKTRKGHPHMRAPQNDIDAKFIEFSMSSGGISNKDKTEFTPREAIQQRRERDATVEKRRRSPRREQI